MNRESKLNEQVTIDEVVDSFSARLERGEYPSIAEYREKFPHLADRIDAVLPALVMLEEVDSQPAERKLIVDDSIPEVVGDYQIIQEIGRGGMGIVFEARHLTMRRRVALKVLPKSAAEKAGYLPRFMTEARSAGQLHHTNIVPVFEVGESNGLHFYAMQFIHGDNLDRVIDDIKRIRTQGKSREVNGGGAHEDLAPTLSRSVALSLVGSEDPQDETADVSRHPELRAPTKGLNPNSATTEFESADLDHSVETMESSSGLSDSVFGNSEASTISRAGNPYHQRVAAVGVQVAEAVEHAHLHGVLHRDVKPANLILDTEGNVWITDFGLAKYQEDLTQTGDVIGTLRYMAPERFKGDADCRSDIYSLGLTLYELATLRCAFDGVDRANLINDVNHRVPVAPRKIDERIPADLETIILKSIDAVPERRYQSAAELSSDLRLFLADRPIKARRTSWAERVWRICRRNPVTASMLACIALLLVVLVVGSLSFAIFSADRIAAEIDARKTSQQRLYDSKLDQAKMRRFSDRMGQRFESTQAIREATELVPELEFDEQTRLETIRMLRNEAIAAMSLADVKDVWHKKSTDYWGYSQKISFDPSYTYYAEGHFDGRVRVRKLAGKAEPDLILPSPGLQSWGMQFSPDGRYLAVTYNDENALYRDVELHVWDLKKPNAPIQQMMGVVNFDFDDQSKQLAYSFFDGGAEVLSLEDGKVTHEVAAESNSRFIRFSSDGTQVAICIRGKRDLQIWSLLGPKPRKIWASQADENITSMDWNSERGVLAAGTSVGNICYWIGELNDEPARIIKGHQSEIKRLHIHPRKLIVATEAYDATVRLTDLAAEKEMLRIDNSESLLESGFSRDGRLGHYQNDIRVAGIWHVAEPVIRSFSTANTRGKTACFHPRFPEIIFRATNAGVEIWNTKTTDLIHQFAAMTDDVVVSKDGKVLLTSGFQGIDRRTVSITRVNGELKIALGEPHRIFDGSTQTIKLNHAGDMLVAASKLRLIALNPDDGTELVKFGRHSRVSSLAITADDRWLLTGASRGKGIGVWDMETGEQVQMILSDQPGVSAASHPLNPNVFATSDIGIRFWDTQSWKQNESKGVRVLSRSNLEMMTTNSVFSNDAQFLGVNSRQNQVVLISPETSQVLAKIETADSNRLMSFCFSPDASQIAVSCFDELQLIDLTRLRDELTMLGLDW